MNKKILSAVIVISFILAITRGWVLLVAVPFWAFSTLALLYGSVGFSKLRNTTKMPPFDVVLLYVWPLLLTTTLFCTVGGGDTTRVEVFGFVTVDSASTIASLSSLLARIFAGSFIALTLVMLFELHRLRLHVKPQSVKRRAIFLIGISLVASFFLYTVFITIQDSMLPPVRYCNGKVASADQVCGVNWDNAGSRTVHDGGVDVQTIPLR